LEDLKATALCSPFFHGHASYQSGLHAHTIGPKKHRFSSASSAKIGGEMLRSAQVIAKLTLGESLRA